MFDSLSHIGDTFARLPFLFFIELVTTRRLTFLYNYWKFYSSWIASICPSCLCLDESHMGFIITVAFIICTVASVIYIKGTFTVVFIVTNLFLVYIMFVNYMSLLYTIALPTFPSTFLSSPHLSSLVQWHCILGCSLLSISLLYLLINSMFKRIPTYKFILIIILYSSVLFVSSLPAINKYSSTGLMRPDNARLKTVTTTTTTHSKHSLRTHVIYALSNFSPTWLLYVYTMFKPNCCVKSLYYSSDVDCNSQSLCLSNNIPLLSLNKNDVVVSDPIYRHDMILLTCSYGLLCIYILLLLYCLNITNMYEIFITCVNEELELYRFGIVEYITFHWNRLDVPQILMHFWSFKVMSVIILGPIYWNIIPAGDMNVGDISAKIFNSSTLVDYSNLDVANQSTLSLLRTRLFVGLFVHGSETWLSVCGAAAFFGVLATVFVSILVFILDPSGDGTARLAMVVADAPADPHAWNVIDDPALALDQNDVIAVELLASTGWNCAVVFLFLAFQSDMPNLPPVYRASCSMYGIMVLLIACIHPIQALIKSFLLRLGIPGQQTNWLAHIRPLCFCVVLIFATFNMFTNLPKILTNDRLEYIRSMNHSENASYLAVLSHIGSSEEAILARRLRIFLSGCQLLISLIVTLIEYTIYQYSYRYPNWTGFQPTIFWTRVISSVIDYLISLLSFLTVCWLVFYDSIGLCRLIIICCYFSLVLYPSARRAYIWITWRLLSTKRMNDLLSPSKGHLERFGNTCPICYTEMTTNTAKITRCGHLYHSECLIQWMKRQLSCPICQSDLLSTKVTDRRRVTSYEMEETPDGERDAHN
uniref:Protein TRC8 homolog n=1 Tax=Schistosoma japonicum TaxID=6182 RepID=C1L3T6_SCHJA|nr:Protein TRC8 homolog [Schistosoma japonicum]